MTYRIRKGGRTLESDIPGQYAGARHQKIFGRLDCASGKAKLLPRNRVFFHTLEDAVREGYRPCNRCRPMGEEEFARVQHLVPEKTLAEFYRRGIR